MTLPSQGTPGPDHAAPYVDPVDVEVAVEQRASELVRGDERPQPVEDIAKKLGALVAAAFVAVGLVWFLILGGINAENLSIVGVAVGAAVTAVVALGSYLWALRKGREAAAVVTPLASPRDAEGRPLVPVKNVEEMQQ